MQLTPDVEKEIPKELWQNRNRLLMFAYRMVGQVEDAEDILQDVFIKTIQFTETGGSVTGSWFYKVLSNACIDFIRGRNRRGMLRIPELEYGRPGTNFSYNEILQPAADFHFQHARTPEESWLAKEELHYAVSLVAQFLPPKERAIYLLFELLDLPAAEIGRQFGLTEAAVYSRLKRARARIENKRAVVPPTVSLNERAFSEAFVTCFEAGDLEGLVSLFAPDGELNMPPYRMHFTGEERIREFLAPKFKTIDFRLTPLTIAGGQAFALYENEKGKRPLSFRGILVPFTGAGKIKRLTNFIYPELAIVSRVALEVED